MNVKSVYPPNVEAHTYEPSSKTMAEISDSDAFIYSGVGVEGFADKAVNTLKTATSKSSKPERALPFCHVKKKANTMTMHMKKNMVTTMSMLTKKNMNTEKPKAMIIITTMEIMTRTYGLILSLLKKWPKTLKTSS